MKRRKTLLTVSLTGLLLLSLTQGAAAQAPQELGMLEVNVQVDGLSCPFCAYGLEKKLRKVENVASLEIQVSEGRAVLKPKPGTSLDLRAVEQATRDGGFTPREVSVTARICPRDRNSNPAPSFRPSGNRISAPQPSATSATCGNCTPSGLSCRSC